MTVLSPAVRSLYPFQSQFLKLNGFSYHYLDEGAGDPVLMLHGNPAWSFHFRDLLQKLKGSYRVIAPDHFGCGLSANPPDNVYDYCLESRIRDVEALLSHLGISRDLTLIMHDWGGPIGIGVATRNAGLVGRMVALNTASFKLPPGVRLPTGLLFFRNSSLSAFLVQRLNLFARLAYWIGCRQKKMPPDVKYGYLAPFPDPDSRRAILHFIRDIPLSPEDPSYPILDEMDRRLTQLSRLPLLICWGEKDPVFHRDFIGEWMRRFPKAELHRFPKAGHYVLEDAPEEVIGLIQHFLNETAHKHDRSIAR